MIRNVKELVDAELEGRERLYTWRKTPSQSTTAGLWFDLSMSPGRPAPKYWFDGPPAIAKAASYTEDGGLEHGVGVSPQEKYLRLISVTTMPNSLGPVPLIMCDYLLYYPSIDDSIDGPQSLTNIVTLPRYSDGKGVQVIAVSVAGRTGGASFFFTYTNSEGQTGRVSKAVFQNGSAAVGTLQCSGVNNNISAMPFIGLESGDSGVRSIESVTMLTPDVGLMSLILVKPICTLNLRGIDAMCEKDLFLESGALPRIYDDAYLNFLIQPSGSLATNALIGDIKTIWI